MSGVVLAQLLDPLGLASELHGVASHERGRTFDVRRRHWVTPPADVRVSQPAWIPLRAEHHGAAIGQCLHLHRPVNGSLWACFSCDHPLRDRGFFVSVETSSVEGEAGVHIDTIVDGAALCERSAQVGLDPARYLPGRLDYPEVRRGWKLTELERRIIEQAATTVRKGRGLRDPIEVHDDASPEVVLMRRSLESLHPLEAQMLMEDQAEARRRQFARWPVDPNYVRNPPTERPTGPLRRSV